MPPKKETVRTSWEYLEISIDGLLSLRHPDRPSLSELGKDGWELVAVYDGVHLNDTGANPGPVAVFKRPL